jgi:hypothetical protein
MGDVRRQEFSPHLRFAEVFGRRPGDPGGLRGVEVFIDNAEREVKRAGNLTLR